MSVSKLVHFATMSGAQVPLQEMKISVRFSTGRCVNLISYVPFPFFTCLLLQISFYMSATQALLEVMKMSVK